MSKIAIVGSGISGLSLAQMLKDKHDVTVFEKAPKVGGLVKCDRVQDNLFHRVGGHVFNSRRQDVLDWFWSFFNRDTEFIKARRNAKILMGGKIIGYPIENYLDQLEPKTVEAILKELLELQQTNKDKKPEDYPNFAEFLKGNFGPTLYEIYFQPYNHKIWNTDLTQVPLGWLEGKLPMPNLLQMLMSNIIKQEEGEMVHATFYYAKEEGSQFIVNRMAQGLNIKAGTPVDALRYEGGKWLVNGTQSFDKVVFCGDLRMLHAIIKDEAQELHDLLYAARNLRSDGTSNLFCETDDTDISWLYLPENNIQAHRIIYTGNFAESNNRGSKRKTCVVEFSGKHSYEYMVEQVKQLPGNLTPLDWNYEPNSYVVQDTDTRDKVNAIKAALEKDNMYLLGRFAEWEYYNMDKAIEASMELTARLG